MNLFLCACGLPAERHSLCLDALRSAATLYPPLAESPLWSRALGLRSEILLGLVGPERPAEHPRTPVAESGESVLLFDGLAPTVDGADPAGAMLRDWDRLPATLEGQCAAIRADGDAVSLEALTDPLGVYQVYAVEDGGCWLLSNSVRLLAQLTGRRAVDPLGASLMGVLGWSGADRTLVEGVRALDGGSRYVWSAAAPRVSRRVYFDPTHVAPKKSRATTLSTSIVSVC